MNSYIGIDTAESGCSVSVAVNGKIAVVHEFRMKNVTNEKLADMLMGAVKQSGTDYNSIEAVFIAAGPGSYTGLRIGFSLARGYVFAGKIPLIAIPTPEIWAYKYRHCGNEILAVTDAHREEVYVNAYNVENTIPRAVNPSVLVKGVADVVESYAPKDIVVCGSGVAPVQSWLEKHPTECRWRVLAPHHDPVNAGDVVELGMELMRAGRCDAYDLEEPLYVRDFKGAY